MALGASSSITEREWEGLFEASGDGQVQTTEGANKVARDALELAAYAGLDECAHQSRLVRDLRVSQIYEGTSEVQRIVIGRCASRSWP